MCCQCVRFCAARSPARRPVERAAIYDDLNATLARLHQVDFAAIGLADYGRPGNYFQRQIDRWIKQYRGAETENIPAMERLMAELPGRIPPGDEVAIAHGDYRLDNVMFHPTEPRILAVLDWELSTLGDPLVDFAYHCMTWRMDGSTGRGLGDLTPEQMAQMMIPSESDYVKRYCTRTGRDGIPERDWSYYMVFNMFRLTGILQGVMKRALQGNAASAEALATGKRARPLAEQAWRMVEQMRAA